MSRKCIHSFQSLGDFMSTLLQQVRLPNRLSRGLLFGCGLLAFATIASPQEGLANNLTICKATIPPTGPSGPSFNFTGANSWPPLSPNGFTKSYVIGPPVQLPSNPFPLRDSLCRTLNLANHDQFNKITESGAPPGWTLTNIQCNYLTSAVHIVGATVNIDQTEPNVTCTFVNSCAFAPQDISTGKVKWLVTRPSGATAVAYPVPPYPQWATHSPPVMPPGPPFPPGTSWIQPANAAAAVNEPGGLYIYQVRFSIPCPGTVQGWFAADNAATLQIDNNPPVPCLGNPSLCFTQANVTNFGPQPVGAGGHVIRVRVTNLGITRTGLLAHITVQ
jgi:hypothetical protein